MEVKHTHASVALAVLSRLRRASSIVELGSGNGVVLVLLAILNPSLKNLVGIEVNAKNCVFAQRIVEMNDLADRVRVVNADVREAPRIFGNETADAVVFNPPFHLSGRISSDGDRFLERNADVFDDFVIAAKKLLKYRHRFFMVTSPRNTVSDFAFFTENGMVPKAVTPIYGKKGVESKLVFIEGMKGGNPGDFKFNPPFFLDEIESWKGKNGLAQS